MNSHRSIISKRDFGTVGRPWPIDTRSLVNVFAWPMFPDIAFKTTIHAIAESEMPAGDTTVGEGPTNEPAEALLEADAKDGMGAPDAATGSAGIDAGMPCRPGLQPMIPGPALWRRKTLLASGQTHASNCCTN